MALSAGPARPAACSQATGARARDARLAGARKAVSDLASAVGFDAARAFGREDEVDPIDHLLVVMSGWAG